MRPDWHITADGVVLSQQGANRLLLLEVVDNAGEESDTASIELDDRDSAIALPRKGAKLAIKMGYKETAMANMGLFVVDEVRSSGFPRKISISARAADMRETFKEHKTRNFTKKKIGDIVGQIAGEHGLNAVVSPELKNTVISYLPQTEESDMHLLDRIAHKRGAIVKAAGGNLLFVKRGQEKTASGKIVPIVSVSLKDFLSWDAKLADRPSFGKITAYWHDRAEVKRTAETVQGGGQGPEFTIRNTFNNKDDAKAAAEAKSDELKRGEATLSAEMGGNPLLMAESTLIVTGIRPGVDGDWKIASSTHRIAEGAVYTTSIEAEQKTS